MDSISLKSQKRRRLIIFILVNTIQYPCTLKSNICHSNKRGPPPFFYLDTNPLLGHFLIHSVDKTNALVVAVELTCLLFLNKLSFNFVPTPKKFLRLKKFRKSYVNRPDVVLTNPTSYTAFLLDVRCAVLCGRVPFFCCCLSPLLVHLHNLILLITPVDRMLLTQRWVSRRKDVKQLSINISKLTVGVKHSISHKTTFSPDPHLVEEVTCFPFFGPRYGL